HPALLLRHQHLAVRKESDAPGRYEFVRDGCDGIRHAARFIWSTCLAFPQRVVIGFGRRTIVDWAAFFKLVLRSTSASSSASTPARCTAAVGGRSRRLLRDQEGAGGYQSADEADQKSFHSSYPFRLPPCVDIKTHFRDSYPWEFTALGTRTQIIIDFRAM